MTGIFGRGRVKIKTQEYQGGDVIKLKDRNVREDTRKNYQTEILGRRRDKIKRQKYQGGDV